MSLNTPFVLVPISLTDAMLTASSIAEPAAGETAWVSGGTYVIDDERIVAATHKVYSCVKACTGRTVSPELDPNYWLAKRPTAKWAAFDGYSSTASESTGTLSYTLRPGFCNALDMLAIVGTSATVTVKNGPGGTVAASYTSDLLEPFAGLYELLTQLPRQRTKLLIKDLPFLPDPEIIITITNGASGPVALGMLALGDLRPLLDDTSGMGTLQGAQAKPGTYGYIKNNSDGSWVIVPGLSATDMSFSVAMPLQSANAALATIQAVLNVPCVLIATLDGRFDGLNIFGLISGVMRYGNPICELQLDAKGSI